MTQQDTSLEARLRATLVDMRPAEGAPSRLRVRVESIPHQPRDPMWMRAVKGRGIWFAATGIAVVAIAIATAGFSRIPWLSLPSGAPTTTSPGFDPALVGPGLIADDFAPLPDLFGMLLVLNAAAVAFATFIGPRIGTNRGRVVVVIALLGIAIGFGFMRPPIGLTAGGLRGAPVGYTWSANQFTNQNAWISIADPGDPLVGIISLRNTSAVPVRIEGLISYGPFDPDAAGTQWTALWIQGDPAEGGDPGLDSVVPFVPRTMEPGEELNVYLAARAGRCSYGPGYDPDNPPSESLSFSAAGPEFTFAYSVFGLVTKAVIDSGEIFVFPSRNNCA